MHRLLPAVAVVFLAAGCEDQEAVPLARSVPVAVLQLAALLVVVVGGWAVLERRRSRSEPPQPIDGRPLRWAVALVAALPAAAALAFTLLGVATVGFGYEEPTYQLLSWGETAAIVWWFVVLGGATALGQLRAAAALVRGARWAPWVLGVEVVLAVVPGVLGLLLPA